MRVPQIAFAAAACAVLLIGCGGSTAQGPAHPNGWAARGPNTWQKPGDPQQRYSVTSAPNQSGTLAEMGTQIATNTVLRVKGAKLVEARPFAPCPGEAGRQTFHVPGPKGPEVLEVAFTQWNGTAVTVSYRRPANAPDDPAVLEAMRKSVCSPSVGG